jgi:hypothetical protein
MYKEIKREKNSRSETQIKSKSDKVITLLLYKDWSSSVTH